MMTFIIFVCIALTLREFKLMSDNSQYGKNISVYSLLLNCIWNLLIFLSQFMASMRASSDDFPLALPTTMVFVYVLIFQMNMFTQIWKSRNEELVLLQSSPEEIRSNLFKFNCWIYMSIIFGVIVIFNIVFNEVLFGIFMSALWIPQIAQNMINGKSKAPSMLYILGVTLEHLFTPIYALMFDDNFFEFQPNYLLGWIIIGVISIQLIVLCLQKILGIKFFLPKFLRKQLYNYERMIKENDQTAEQLGDCSICLMPVSQSADNYEEKAKSYMETPCKHCFHSKCLEEWIKHKRQCPICRAILPPLDEEDD
eukprot:TRINITY_DN3105_c0_g2_i6.p1 TRINITY_DN3105_c0_g2~~TRINITY_DN3105_c0_g2_i6.p1  ORF type:complete len:310 (+),score=53.29 TRINITY_DN3105_c0_g2_i6:308-1237(+)